MSARYLKGLLLRKPVIALFMLGLAYAAIFLGVHQRLWDGRNFLGWDIVRQGWPNLEFIWGGLARGEVPLWNPFDKGGFSFVADPEAAIFYPLHWAWAALSAALGHTPAVMLVQVLAHVAIGAVGMHVYLRRHGLPAPARWTGSTAYVLSSRLAKSKDQIALGTMVWFPWMVIAVEETVQRPRWRSSALLGTVVGVDLLAGYPPNFFRNLVALALVFIFELAARWSELPREERLSYLRRLTLHLLGAAAIALALAAPQLLALAQVSLGETARSAMSLNEVLASSLRPVDALQFVAPGLRGRSSFLLYLGIVPSLAAAYACLRFDARRLSLVLGAAVFFLFACGGSTFLLPLAVSTLPGFSLFRGPEQYLALTVFFVAALGARGIADLLAVDAVNRSQARLRLLVIGIVAFVINIVALLLAKLARAPQVSLIDAAGAGIVLSLAGLLVLLGLTSGQRHVRRAAMALLLPLLLVDLSLQVRPIYLITDRYPRPQHDTELTKLRGIKDDYRLADDDYFGYRIGLRHRVRDFYGRQTALINERYRRYVKRSLTNRRLLAAANVRYYAGRRYMSLHRQAPKQSRMLGGRVIEITEAAPRAYWTQKVAWAANGNAALSEMTRQPPGEVALLERQSTPKALHEQLARLEPEYMPIRARVEPSGSNQVALAIDAPAAGVLVINESYQRGWQATIDGRPTPLFRVNYLFSGLALPKGPHEVRLDYRPRGLRLSMAIYATTVLGLLGLWCVVWLRRRRSTRLQRQAPVSGE